MYGLKKILSEILINEYDSRAINNYQLLDKLLTLRDINKILLIDFISKKHIVKTNNKIEFIISDEEKNSYLENFRKDGFFKEVDLECEEIFYEQILNLDSFYLNEYITYLEYNDMYNDNLKHNKNFKIQYFIESIVNN